MATTTKTSHQKLTGSCRCIWLCRFKIPLYISLPHTQLYDPCATHSRTHACAQRRRVTATTTTNRKSIDSCHCTHRHDHALSLSFTLRRHPHAHSVARSLGRLYTDTHARTHAHFMLRRSNHHATYLSAARSSTSAPSYPFMVIPRTWSCSTSSQGKPKATRGKIERVRPHARYVVWSVDQFAGQLVSFPSSLQVDIVPCLPHGVCLPRTQRKVPNISLLAR
jgi:hypothetical protein